MEESQIAALPAEIAPWFESNFDLTPFVECTKESRKIASESEAEQASWLAGLITEKVRNDPSELPAFPDLAVRILRFMESPNPDLGELIRIVRADAMVSAQILRTANSAFYSRGNNVATFQDAAIRLGLRAVSNIAIAAATRAMLDSQERLCLDHHADQWKRLSAYCMHCAASARWLSLRLRKGDPEEVYLGGLLHDIGKVVALRTAGKMIPDGDLSPCMPLVTLEAALEEAHVFLGQELAANWQLPSHTLYACAEHHAYQPDDSASNLGLHLIRVTSCLYELRTNPLHRSSLEGELFWSAMKLGLDQQQLLSLAHELKQLGTASSL